MIDRGVVGWHGGLLWVGKWCNDGNGQRGTNSERFGGRKVEETKIMVHGDGFWRKVKRRMEADRC